MDYTMRNRAGALDRFREWLGGEPPVDPALLSAEIDASVSDIATERAWSINTASTYISSLRSHYTSKGIALPRSKVQGSISKKKPKRTTHEKPSLEEIEKIRAVFKKHIAEKRGIHKWAQARNYLLFEMLVSTGQRIGDLLRLKVKDALKPVLIFQQEKTGGIAKMENLCLKLIKEFTLKSGLEPEAYLFSSFMSEDPVEYSVISRSLIEASLEATGKRFSAHCFRVFVVSRLAEKGLSNSQIKSISGHASSSMVDYYDLAAHEITGLKGLLFGEEAPGEGDLLP